MSDIKFTAQEQAEIETLTLTKKIARDVNGVALRLDHPEAKR